MKIKILLCLATAFLFVACVPKWKITEYSSTKIPLDSTTERLVNRQYINYLQTISVQMDAQMSEIIGQSAQTMEVSRPESLLSNFVSDLLRQAATQALLQPIDIGIMNIGGLRTQIMAGEVTVRNMYEVMPFENELVVIWLRGDTLQKVIDEIAAKNGEGISGIKMTIKNRKPFDLTIANEPLDKNRIYSIATNDFMAGGNDELYHLAQRLKIEYTGLKIRDLLIQTFKDATKNGTKVSSQIDGRIKVKNE
ncbi:MAG: 5'-nucleotidase C-terminal domain-containing protein [Prevotellaceae bacterium]|jgi:2',3'-cyclic-nucleotide 2'-phosphodiesterase (5'-nucleotidase family)|nr:5'-nucleotidase C-terminal domain-containing protein [Prevotellaceae bacterium]